MIRQLCATPESTGAITVWMSDLLSSEPRLGHAMTLSGTNMWLAGGGPLAEAVENRRALCRGLDVPFDNLTVCRQIHGAEVLPVDETLAGRGREAVADAIEHVDGLCARSQGQPLLGLTADCPLVVAFDPDTPAVGFAHAGWRGTLAGIAGRLIEVMRRSLSCTPKRMLAAIAPSAGPCCYEVGEDVLRIARARWRGVDRYIRRGTRSACLDLWSANVAQLTAAGMPIEQIDVAGICTICDQRFCSFRRQGRSTQHAGLIVSLR